MIIPSAGDNGSVDLTGSWRRSGRVRVPSLPNVHPKELESAAVVLI